ncbi:hypothetical protein RA26_11900 [Leisingera sp. ANG-M7]|nr:hypothetical protein RA26_11900 [Leisingera sp. ANG-M7]
MWVSLTCAQGRCSPARVPLVPFHHGIPAAIPLKSQGICPNTIPMAGNQQYPLAALHPAIRNETETGMPAAAAAEWGIRTMKEDRRT